MRVGVCLSLSGRYARYGRQTAAALAAWRRLENAVDLIVEDDQSDPRTLQAVMPGVLAGCDIMLGPYATDLVRAAAPIATDAERVLWNHGGSGDDVQAAYPGYLVSVLTPASEYARPYVEKLAEAVPRAPLWIGAGKGSFARQVKAGAEAAARELGVAVAHGDMPTDGDWDLLSAGGFDEDIATVERAGAASRPPRHMCTTAAGVSAFGTAAPHPAGVFGVAQWVPNRQPDGDVLGPREADFLSVYADLADFLAAGVVVPGFLARSAEFPDYPAVQAVAAGILAVHCAQRAASTARQDIWEAAVSLDTVTLFGRFRVDPRTGAQVGHRMTLVRW
ncbi:hypothetical protein DP939_21700 [Spongiactinospora rosea]|uniref:Leucine-binding protein domain-containing protein n=1 Tax=Spongiactinospora rosea TaxID=2248750 RepID=A0A366LWP0_9ACTN|nr:ABC transporter substrate-binding protein [Spongiactinospora rosea]RBQ17990.1 hypothetical protein DP939_21700 [Spongiactinospora rosea]